MFGPNNTLGIKVGQLFGGKHFQVSKLKEDQALLVGKTAVYEYKLGVYYRCTTDDTWSLRAGITADEVWFY